MKKQPQTKSAIVYQAKSGAIELRGDFMRDTIWATQAQIADIFDIERSVVTRHIGNILKNKEVDEKSNVQKMHIANSDRPITFYSLDMILAVGYRTNSARAIGFRQWATKMLRQYIIEGYAINRKRIAKNYDVFMRAVEDVRALLPPGMQADTGNILELVRVFADTWVSLEAYDEDKFPVSGATKQSVNITADQLSVALASFKGELMKKSETTDLFGRERQDGSVAGIVGNIMQSFGGKPVYATAEEKAAHLLYFMVKNHPFTDGNKRSGAFSFVWFLRRAKMLDTARMSPAALTALTLLIAESKPADKQRMIGLVLLILKK